MSRTVLILGARGRFGRAARQAFAASGWQIRAFARTRAQSDQHPPIKWVYGNAFQQSSVEAAAQGCDVIVNALNPPYPKWARDLPRLTASVLGAAQASGATVMIPGNVYNYGRDMPEILTEETPHRPTTRKGQLREEMEHSYRRVSQTNGIQTLILRGGDFMEREKTGNWFDSFMTQNLGKGQITYPGALDCMHAWAYLPDMAKAMVGLADRRQAFGAFEQFGFEGFSLSGAALITAIEKTLGQTLKVKSMPWGFMSAFGFAVPTLREVLEMRYLWDVPHRIDGTKLARILPEFQPTALDAALRDVLGVEDL